ncbi:MAG TPA: peptidoglycan DD-metalloendopeptidase family protein, partial [Gemmatimonadales bacterium]|nr:peptidoglycan DD-metalloendopeptidase family protein [Gemmatimonadales bacterium]
VRMAGGRVAGALLRAVPLLVLLPFASLPSAPLAPVAVLQAQGVPKDVEESRRRLEEIRAERDRLRQQQQRLQGQVHDVEDELSNLERQRESTNRIVNEIERQIGGLATQLDRSTAELILAEDNLAERNAVLQRRLVDIYKRGALYTFQALLAAETFSDLLSRYKYLFLTSRQDRQLVADVETLRNRIVAQRNNVLSVRSQLDRTREEREAELKRYGQLVQERERRATQLRRTAKSTEQRLTALERDEAQIQKLLATLDRRRTDAESRAAARGTARAAGTITTADLGKLAWPVDGRIVYRFGRDTLPSGGIIRWNGIGIGAAAGTPVRAVEAGTVGLVGQVGTYGLTVAVEHGNGYWSLYMQLDGAAVKQGDKITRGQTIGAVGGQNSDYGPHLHFEIRGENQIALDPTEWLRRR